MGRIDVSQYQQCVDSKDCIVEGCGRPRRHGLLPYDAQCTQSVQRQANLL